LFGEGSNSVLSQPKYPPMEPYGTLEKLKIEKEVVGFYITGHPLDQFKIEIKYFCTCSLEEIENYKNKVIHIGGIVIKFTERYTKNGNPFGLFTMEDFHGVLDMAMFGEEYLKNRHFLNPGSFLYLTGKVEERYNQPGVWEFRPKVIQLLSDVRESLSDELGINLDISDLSNALLDNLEKVIINSPGKCKLKVNLTDIESGIKVDLISKKYMVYPTNELFENLGKYGNIELNLLSKKVEIPLDRKPEYRKFVKA